MFSVILYPDFATKKTMLPTFLFIPVRRQKKQSEWPENRINRFVFHPYPVHQICAIICEYFFGLKIFINNALFMSLPELQRCN